MSEASYKALRKASTVDPDLVDFGGAHTAAFYRKRCEKLGFNFPPDYYEAFALFDHGIRAKQYRSMLKKQSKKMRHEMKATKISFD
jgi:hypothetical protein